MLLVEVGGRAVLREQLDHLVKVAGLPNVEAGGHAAMHIGAFAILDFADPDDPPVVCLESHTGARYLEKPEELTEYRKVYDLIFKKTVPIEEYPP